MRWSARSRTSAVLFASGDHNRMYQLQCWLIQPASPDPWHVDYYSEAPRLKSFAHRNLERPDEWLLPLRPHGIDLVVEGIRKLPVSESGSDHVVGCVDPAAAKRRCTR